MRPQTGNGEQPTRLGFSFARGGRDIAPARRVTTRAQSREEGEKTWASDGREV